MLAFDPFDTQTREVWLKTATRTQKIDALSRLLKRLGTDQDMPPEDSQEAKLFRAKNTADFDSVQRWLEAELKRAKAN